MERVQGQSWAAGRRNTLLVTASAAAPTRSPGDGTAQRQGSGDRTGWGWGTSSRAAFLQADTQAERRNGALSGRPGGSRQELLNSRKRPWLGPRARQKQLTLA